MELSPLIMETTGKKCLTQSTKEAVTAENLIEIGDQEGNVIL